MRRETIRIRLLGGFALSVGPRTVDADRWRLKKATSLIKLLGLAPRHTLHREKVADLLWPGVDAYALSGHRLEALRLYERLRNKLSQELVAHPTDTTRRLYDALRAGSVPEASPPARSSEAPAPNNLPVPLTSFVGRGREVLGIERSLSMTRLMTLTGTGGSGKTRLALEVARGLVGTYAEGVWLAELAPLSDPALVARAVAATLGVREHPDLSLTQAICNHLGSGRTLLVLDNCEHLVGAAARFTRDLLSACEGLTVLATSREPLRVSGEIVCRGTGPRTRPPLGGCSA